MDGRTAMKRALTLALKGRGFVSPNPLVGAVIFKDGVIISEGWHERFGGPHAEVNAVRNAGNIDFSDCTIAVTLEPCCHYGKTPPCTELLISKKFKKVIIGMKDPNPLVAGKGINLLRTSGIEVETGVLEKECKWQNRVFIKHITENKPYIILKTAQSLNGAIATATGESQWITGDKSRKAGHALRAEVDGILVGKGTASADNPKLTVRHIRGRNPKRIVLDTRLELQSNLNLFSDKERNNTIIVCGESSYLKAKKSGKLFDGVHYLITELTTDGTISLEIMLKKLHDEYSVASMLIEGGPKIWSAFIGQNLADELRIFISPQIIGNGINAFSGLDTLALSESKKFSINKTLRHGDDIELILTKINP